MLVDDRWDQLLKYNAQNAFAAKLIQQQSNAKVGVSLAIDRLV